MTSLRLVGGDRVAVDVDGERWGVVPLQAVQEAGLAVGLDLDRRTLRALGRGRRRAEALGAALGALRYRDHSTASLADRLEQRGIRRAERRQAVETLARAGLVDDERFAHGRAAALAGRGAGDVMIADDLDRHGLPRELVEGALAALEPEVERAARLVAARGPGPTTWRFLARKGFTPETLETLVADSDASAIG